jgi:FixJ family two-component response regulator/glycine cleavage system H lipoate-binding protein
MANEPTLLVVDDEEAICEGCRRIFSRQGFQVRKCNNANEGLSLATQIDCAAILLDVKMPEMDGLQFLEALRKSKPNVPVVLMTGYPSIPNAASAVRLGASDYVTKPFTPEEISQAVHRLLHADANPAAAAHAVEAPASDAAFRFYREAWFQTNKENVARVGALVGRPGAAKIESLRLPRIGEVVYQGLPLAAVTVAGQSQRWIPSPLSGVVVAVNDSLSSDPAAVLSDPCGQGWMACICPTRLEEESHKCLPRRVVLLSQDAAASAEQAQRLRRLGCDVRSLANPKELEAAQKDFDSKVLLFDAKTFGAEGPGIVGALNAENPSLKIVVMASADCDLESAYRVRRILYYAVEPFADNEIMDILAAAFGPPTCPTSACHHGDNAQSLGGLFITNRNRSRVRLIPAPGLLRREAGLGLMLRHKLMQERFPLESSPSETPITPMHLLSTASHCDRVIVLLAQQHGRLPGSLTRDTKAEYIAMVGAGADKVTTLLVEPSESAENPLAFEPQVVEALADHLTREMANC